MVKGGWAAMAGPDIPAVSELDEAQDGAREDRARDDVPLPDADGAGAVGGQLCIINGALRVPR